MPWNKIQNLVPLPFLLAAACMDIPEHSVCGSELICPPHRQCDPQQGKCILGSCGNGIIDDRVGEACDDGNDESGDGCSKECLLELDLTTRLALGGSHTCALSSDAALHCWGAGDYGQLGYGHIDTIGDDETPASAGRVNIGGSVIQVAAGESHTCALLETGAVRCWGRGDRGQLGYGNQSSIIDPLLASEVPVGTAVQLTAGWNHTCALLTSGAVRCWGDGTYGRLGYGNVHSVGDDEMLDSVAEVDVGGRVIQLVAGGNHTCALRVGGRVRCWGHNTYGQLGYGNTFDIGDDENPVSAGDVDVGGPVIQLAAGGNHTCALLEGGAIRCWGLGLYGQLGYGHQGNIGDDETPASAGDVNVGGGVIQLAVGGEHTCALLGGGAVRCWGSGAYGQLGQGNTNNAGGGEMPILNADLGGELVIALAAGNWHTCAIRLTGAIRCWGRGNNGQLGYGNKANIGNDELPSSVGYVSYE